MTEIIGSLGEIDPGYSALFCDLWGCLHDGVEAFPEAVAALEAFRGRGGTVVLLTNSPRPAGDVARQLDLLGAPRSCWDLVVSSGDAAQAAMDAEDVRGHRLRVKRYVIPLALPDKFVTAEQVVRQKRLLRVNAKLGQWRLRVTRMRMKRIEIDRDEQQVGEVIRGLAEKQDLIVVHLVEL